MAYYTRDELQAIVLKLASEESEIKYVKHEKLGVLFTPLKENNLNNLYTCQTCKKCLLSSHLLSLHVAEHHDTFFQLQKERKPSFACYLEDCKVLSKTHNDRKDHTIKDHKFPPNFYDFKNQESKDEDVVMECEPSGSSKKKSNYFQFGHKANKTFQSKPKSKDINMKDLMDVLPS